MAGFYYLYTYAKPNKMRTSADNTAVISISSSLPSYRLCWLLNNELDINFIRKPELDICLRSTTGKKEYVPIYQSALLNGALYILYKLKGDENYFLPENKQADYLWMVQSTCINNDVKKLTNQLLSLPDVQPIEILQTNELKHFDELICI